MTRDRTVSVARDLWSIGYGIDDIAVQLGVEREWVKSEIWMEEYGAKLPRLRIRAGEKTQPSAAPETVRADAGGI